MDADAAEVAAALAAVYESAAPDEEELELAAAQDAAGGAAPAAAARQRGGKVQRVSRRSRAGGPLDKELPIEMLPKVDAGLCMCMTFRC